MWRKILQRIMDRRPTKLYWVDGRPLFYRAYLFTFLGRVWYLHHYLRSDPDGRGWHNHPMRATAIILAGGYVEERIAGFGRNGCYISKRHLGPGRINFVSEHVFHRVVIPLDRRLVYDRDYDPFIPVGLQDYQPTSWSLFISRYVPGKSWGFMGCATIGGEHLEGGSQRLFAYEEAGPGIDDEEPWWKTAPNGLSVRIQAGKHFQSTGRS